MQSRNTDDIYPETTIPQPEPQAMRFVDIHIYPLVDQDEQETRTIEATLDEISQENQPPDEWKQEQSDPSPKQPGRKLSPILVVVVGVMLLALLGKGYLYLLPLLTPPTTITIIPVSRHIQVTQSIQIVTGTPDSTKNQIPGRMLSSITLSQAQTIPTTGKAHQDAQPAHGTITFYNAAPSAQTIPTGMLLTGKSGTRYTTDQTAIIAAAAYPTFGQATVSAHVLGTGPTGNQPSGDIYGPCCLLNISAVSSAFVGGQDGREYQTVTDQDISTTADTLKASLQTSAYAALQTQIHQGETIGTPVCTNTVASDHHTGDEATQVSVTVNQTCTTFSYQTAALQTVMGQAVRKQVQRQLGTGYTQIGDITVTVKGQQGPILSVQARSVWYTRFDAARLSSLSNQLAGKNKQEATRFLLHTQGIAQIEGLPDSLPTDPASIRVLVLYA